MEHIKILIDYLSKILEAVGVMIIVLGSIFFLLKFAVTLFRDIRPTSSTR